MIINLRGTNGSGKTTIARALLKRLDAKPIYGCLGPNYPEAYILSPAKKGGKPLYVIGPYHSATGGLDALTGRGFAYLIELLEKYRKKGNIFFEGVLVSMTYGSVGEWMAKYKDNAVVVFLDTPLDICLKSLEERQAKSDRHSGNKHVTDKYKAILRVQTKMRDEGFWTELVPRDEAVDLMLGWLE